jgi:4-amino-4-deoxy-L-arabinose transferase-like glycosyltransferase
VKFLSWLDDPRIVVPLLLLLALVLRLPNLTESLWYDEVHYSTRFISSDFSELWQVLTSTPPAPLYPVMTFVWTGLVGESELIVRAPSMVFGLASIALTYVLARRFGGPTTASLACLLLCLWPAHIWYSQEATPYAMAVCFMLAAIVAWPHVAKPEFSARWLAAYVGAFVVAALTHYYLTAFLVPLTVLGLAAGSRGRRRIVMANALVALSLAVVLGFQYSQGGLPTGGMSFLRPFTLFEWWMLFFHWGLHGNSLWQVSPYRAAPAYLLEQPLLLALQIVVAGLTLRGLVAARRDGGPRWELAACMCSLPAVMWILTLAGRDRLYIERYLLAVMPFFAIALARGATAWTDFRVRAASAGFVVALAVASFAAYSARSDQWTVYKQNPDWKSTVRFLSSEIKDPARARMVAATPPDDLNYYARKALPRRARVTRFDRRQLPVWLEDGNVDTIYLIDNLYWRGDIERALAEFADEPRFRMTGLKTFKGVELYTFAVTAQP